ncbi:MAG TPA: CAP domain-containing protein [Thermoleophilaceae bacterium]
MPGARIVVAGVVALAVALPAAAEAGSEGDPLLDGINGARARHGLAPLRSSDRLHRSASAFAGHLMRTQRFAHSNRNHASSRFRTLGEMLAIRIGSPRWQPRAVVHAWLHSAAHRALMLSRKFRYAGAGHSRGRFGGRKAVIWVLHLGSR